MSKKITFDMALPMYHAAMNTYLFDNQIDPENMDQDELDWLLEIGNYFFLAGLHFAARVGGVEVEKHNVGNVH